MFVSGRVSSWFFHVLFRSLAKIPQSIHSYTAPQPHAISSAAGASPRAVVKVKVIRAQSTWSLESSWLQAIGSMGRTVYLPTWMVAFYGFHVGKYTVRPMDPSWELLQPLQHISEYLQSKTVLFGGEKHDPGKPAGTEFPSLCCIIRCILQTFGLNQDAKLRQYTSPPLDWGSWHREKKNCDIPISTKKRSTHRKKLKKSHTNSSKVGETTQYSFTSKHIFSP